MKTVRFSVFQDGVEVSKFLTSCGISKAEVETQLVKRFHLKGGSFMLSYIDPDGDEIIAEVEEDFAIADLTTSGEITFIVGVGLDIELGLKRDNINKQLEDQLLPERQIEEPKVISCYFPFPPSANQNSSCSIEKKQPLQVIGDECLAYGNVEESHIIESDCRKDPIKDVQKVQQIKKDAQNHQSIFYLTEKKAAEIDTNEAQSGGQLLKSRNGSFGRSDISEKPKAVEILTKKKSHKKQKVAVIKKQKQKSRSGNLGEKQIAELVRAQIMKMMPYIKMQIQKDSTYKNINGGTCNDIQLSEEEEESATACCKCKNECFPFFVNPRTMDKFCVYCQSVTEIPDMLVKINTAHDAKNIVRLHLAPIYSYDLKSSPESRLDYMTQCRDFTIKQIKQSYAVEIQQAKVYIKQKAQQKKAEEIKKKNESKNNNKEKNSNVQAAEEPLGE